MSHSNRPDNKSPNPKLARYLHRIQQLVGNRGRTPSPISSRINKPIKPNSLDHYIKYELTFKILCGFFDKSNKTYMRNFFNKLRTCQNSKVQKIYKFVPIEKTQCAHMIVDSGISTKMLANVLKTKLKSQLKIGFDALKNSHLVDSNISAINTGRSNMTNKSNIQTLNSLNQKINPILLVLKTLSIKREASTFYQIKNCTYKYIQLSSRQIATKQEMKQINNSLKINLLSTLFQKIQQRNLYQSYNNLKLLYSQKLIQQEHWKSNKLKQLLNFYIIQHKSQVFRVFNKLKVVQKQKQIEYLFERLKQQSMKQNTQKQTKKQIQLKSVEVNTVDCQSNIYEAVNKINVGLISIIIRRKSDALKSLQRYMNKKHNLIYRLVHIFDKKILTKLSPSFEKLVEKRLYNSIQLKSIKSTQIDKFKSQSINWKAVSHLNNIEKLFLPLLFEAFNQIKFIYLNHQENKNRIQKGSKFLNIILLKVGFSKLKQYNFYGKLSQNLQKQKQQFNNKQKQYLPKTLIKLLISIQADSFIKMKYHKKKVSIAKNNRKSEWMNDINNFLEQRDKFNKVSLDKISKMQQLVHKNGIEDLNRQATKYVFSPSKNKNSPLLIN